MSTRSRDESISIAVDIIHDMYPWLIEALEQGRWTDLELIAAATNLESAQRAADAVRDRIAVRDTDLPDDAD